MTLIQHIAVDPQVCGGKACIAGTRIRVWDIHVWHDMRGQSPEEIVVQFPQLTVADVYAALAYYHDHRSELEPQMRDAARMAERMDAEQGRTPFPRMRGAIA